MSGVSRLPSVMQAKKAEMEVMLPAMEQPRPTVKKPVPVQPVAPKQEEKKVEEEKPLDIADFAVTEETEDKPGEEAKPVEQKPVVVEKKEDEEQNDWKWKYKSLEGNHNLILKENRELRDRFVALETRFEDLQKKQAEPPKPQVSLDLTKEEQEQYGDALPVLTKLLAKQRREIEDSVVKPLQDKITTFEKSSTESQQKFASNEEAMFLQSVMSQVKDFNSIIKSPKWQEFVAKPASDIDETPIGAKLQEAHDRRDLVKVVKIFENYNKSLGNNMADAFKGPTVSSASAPLPSNEKKPKLALSKRTKASEDFRKGRITLAQLDKIKALYAEADAEGRVDYDH